MRQKRNLKNIMVSYFMKNIRVGSKYGKLSIITLQREISDQV